MTAPQSASPLRPVFLSHNSQEKDLVIKLQQRLESGSRPVRCWLDKDDFRSQGSWFTQLEQVIEDCEVALVFIGPAGEGPIHKKEKEFLITREARSPEKCRVIPVLLPGTKPSDVHGFLGQYNWVDFNPGLDDGPA